MLPVPSTMIAGPASMNKIESAASWECCNLLLTTARVESGDTIQLDEHVSPAGEGCDFDYLTKQPCVAKTP